MKNFFKQYADIGNAFQLYWQAYGGYAALVRSPYLHVAIVFTALSRNWVASVAWIQDCLAVTPSILGFTLGAFAIFLAFSDAGYLTLITAKLGKATEKVSLYLQLCGAFVHFMLAQTLAITFALIGRNVGDSAFQAGWCLSAFSGLGYFLFVYSLLAVVATAFTLLRFAYSYNHYRQLAEQSAESERQE